MAPRTKKKCKKPRVLNRSTGRCKKPCRRDQAVNPRTKRCVSKGYLKSLNYSHVDDDFEFDSSSDAFDTLTDFGSDDDSSPSYASYPSCIPTYQQRQEGVGDADGGPAVFGSPALGFGSPAVQDEADGSPASGGGPAVQDEADGSPAVGFGSGSPAVGFGSPAVQDEADGGPVVGFGSPAAGFGSPGNPASPAVQDEADGSPAVEKRVLDICANGLLEIASVHAFPSEWSR